MRVARATLLLVGLLGATAFAGSPGRAAAPADASWTSFAHDNQIDGYTPAPAFTADVKGFEPVWRAALDGGITASPLAAPVPGHGLVVFAATDNGNVYAVAAGGRILWQRALGTVVTDGNCGTYGIDSTGVVDTKRGLLYVVGASGAVHALRLADGSDAPGWPVQAVVRTATEYVWGGLRLAGGRLYVPVASYCDAPDRNGVPAEGRLLAYEVDDPGAPPHVFDPVPGPDNLGGIWGWGGVAGTAAGDALYTGVGNAEPDLLAGASDSMVELTPDLSRLVGSSRPRAALAGADTDLGAAPVLFQPRGCVPLLAANAKSGELYVWQQGRLRHGPVDLMALSDGIHAFVGAPSWSPRTQMLYDAGVSELKAGVRFVGTIALAVDARCGLTPRWFVATGVGSQPEPLVAGDLVVSTGGSGGGLVVSRARTGVVVWRFPTSAGMLAPPIEAAGLLVAGDEDGNLYAFRPAR